MTGYQSLLGLHAAAGQLGIVIFLWITVELINGSSAGLTRARRASFWGMASLCISWISGGWYYIRHYGPVVKSYVVNGSDPWIHNVMMETKEHLFLFLPFLACLVWWNLRNTGARQTDTPEFTRQLMALCILIECVGFAVAVMGFLVSSAARAGMGGGI